MQDTTHRPADASPSPVPAAAGGRPPTGLLRLLQRSGPAASACPDSGGPYRFFVSRK
jgi:hypothetical protein